jgi:HAD superfamily hydrolase (TIGR01549 family)
LVPKLLAEKGYSISEEEFSRVVVNLRNNLPPALSERMTRYGSLTKDERQNFLLDYYSLRLDSLPLQTTGQNLAELKKWVISQTFKLQKKVLYDDVVSVIKELKEKGLKLFILSGNHSDGISELLEQANILTFFEDLITVDKFNIRKKDNFRILLEKSELKPKQILHIGDDLATDGFPPHQLGINVLIMKRKGQLDFYPGLEHPFPVINNLKTIFNHL